MRIFSVACLVMLFSVSVSAKSNKIAPKVRKHVSVTTQVLQAVALGAALLLTSPASVANEGSATSPAEETFRHFSNSVYSWYTNHDAASWRSSVLTLGVSTQYEASAPTSEGSIKGWFRTSIWKRVTTDDSADWFGYDDFGLRLKVSKGARVPNSSGTLVPLVHFESGASYYEYYNMSADATANLALRWRTRIFKERKSINIMFSGGGGGLLHHPFIRYGDDYKLWGFQSENWDFVATYGVQFDLDTITIGDLLGMEKQTVFAKIPFLPGLDGEYREFREVGDFDKFYRVFNVAIELTSNFSLYYEQRTRSGEDPYKRLTGRIYLEDLF